MRMGSILAARARKGALAIALLVACISIYFEGLFCSVGRKALSEGGGCSFDLTATNSVHISLLPSLLPAIIIPVLYRAYEPKTYTRSFSRAVRGTIV